MSCSKLLPYVLQELPDVTEAIKYPIKDVQRVKYTCFDVSKSLIAFGATSGGIYVFNRRPCEFLQLIPSKDGAITRVAISTTEKHIAFANGRGIVTVTVCDQSSTAHSALTSKEHQGNEVTAMVWRANMLFIGDDVGKISVLQLQNFIAKTMFQSSSQIIMSLDSRICQLDVKDCMLLVSTLTRSFICDTSQEQYRQIGQKSRDGEFGACFMDREKTAETTYTDSIDSFTEAKKFNIVADDSKFAICKGLENTLIYCARPSSRLWEASVDGTVKRTHQFKQVLAKKPMCIITLDGYNKENVSIEKISNTEEVNSVNFSKIYSCNGAIFSFKRDALYFLDIQDVDNTVWYDDYKDVVDCKIYNDVLYLWLANGSLVNLKFMNIDKFLVKCYVDEKYKLCAELCALYKDYLLTNMTPKMHILEGLRETVESNDLLGKIEDVLQKFSDLKANDATQMKSGIYVVDNTYNAQTILESESRKENDDKFVTLGPETIQTLKDLSVTVTDKLHSSKKLLKEKWDEIEDKMKHLNSEKQIVRDVKTNENISNKQENRYIPELNLNADTEAKPKEYDKDIIYKESSQNAIEIDNNNIENLEKDKISKSLYHHYRLSLVGKESEDKNLVSIVESFSCDIREIYEYMLLLEKYCLSIDSIEESKDMPHNIFLKYISASTQKANLLNHIIEDEVLYKYFVDSCIAVNLKTQKLSNLGCECGFPLPYNKTNQTPEFSELIDEFIEIQWSSQSRSQCYDICKKMPYLWRKIIYLRRNEDLQNILQLILQMLDENLLHSFLPQFTLATWNRAIELYAVLHGNRCLNCNKVFEHMSVKEALSWDDLGALIIKSIGGKNAIKIIEKHANLIDPGGLTMKFYHTCLLVVMYGKYDGTMTNTLTDAIYSCYGFEDARIELCNILRNTTNGYPKNTALPIQIAANTCQWGLSPLTEKIDTENLKNLDLKGILKNLSLIVKDIDCSLCGLPLHNDVLINDGGIWTFKCGHTYHGACLDLNKLKLCPSCS